MSLGELVVELGVIGNVKPLQDAINKTKKLTDEEKKLAEAKAKVAQQIDKGIRSFRNVAAVITASVYAVNKLTDALLNNNQQWINLLRQSDITLQSFQKYSEVAGILDRSLGVEGAAQGLASLEQQLYKLQLTGEGASGYLLSGINPMGKSPEQVLEDIRARISGMSDKQATFLLNQMGIDPRMLGMLRLTRSEFEAINNELANYRLTQKQREEMQKLGMQLDIARKKIQYFKDRAIMAIMPHLIRLTQSFVRVTEGVIKLIRAFSKLPTITKFVIGLVAALKLLPAVLSLINAHPIIRTITLITTALYLVIDDIMAFISGGRSGIGYVLALIDDLVQDDRCPEWITRLWDIVSHADKLKEAVSELKDSEKHPVLGSAVEDVSRNKWNLLNPFTYYDTIWRAGQHTGDKLANSIVQHITIHTNEAANAIQNELKYTQFSARE